MSASSHRARIDRRWVGSRRLRFALSTACCLLITGQAAAGDNVPEHPILRVETGGHLASINRIVALSRTQVLTVSDDQTARLWRLPAGTLEKTIRGPAGPRDEGAIYAAAASRRYIALAGRTGWDWGNHTTSVRFLDRASGLPKGVLRGLSAPISSLAFSKDGRLLAIGLMGPGTGVRVFRLGKGKPVLVDKGFSAGISDLAFTGAGRLVAVSESNEVRLYTADLSGRTTLSLPDGFHAWRLALAPDGSRIAVGSRSRPAVALVSLRGDGAVLELHAPAGRARSFPLVAWSRDGRSVIAGGALRADSRTALVEEWNVADQRPVSELSFASATLTALGLTAAGDVVFGNSRGDWGIFAASGREILRRNSLSPDFRGTKVVPLRSSEDGSSILFPVDLSAKTLLRFDLTRRELVRSSGAGTALKGSPTAGGRFTVRGSDVLIDGKPVDLSNNERVLATALAPASGRYFVATNFYLRAYAGNAMIWREAVASPAWSTVVSGNGRFVISALGNGVIEWRRAADGKLILSLFAEPVDHRWVAWTPDGFFDHSIDERTGVSGARLVGFHVNKGLVKEAEFIAIDQMYRIYHRRDVLMAAFRDGPGDRAVVAAALRPGTSLETTLKKRRPPSISVDEICGVDDSGQVTVCTKPSATATRGTRPYASTRSLQARNDVELIIGLEDNGGGVGQIEVRRNGASISSRSAGDLVRGTSRVVRRRLHLLDGDNTIQVTAFDAGNKVASNSVELTINGPPKSSRKTRRAIHVVAVGVSDYAFDPMDLQKGIAANDARGIAEAFTSTKDRIPYYSEADSIVLLEQNATMPNIRKAFAELAKRAREDDLVIVFFSGHGDVVDGEYYFAPHEMGMKNLPLLEDAMHGKRFGDQAVREVFRREGLKQSELLDMLSRIRAQRVIVMLDTCYAGSFSALNATQRQDLVTSVTERVARDSGRFILASARGLAHDSDGKDYPKGVGHGLFTSYALSGLKGEADTNRNGEVSLSELGEHVKLRVIAASRNWEIPQVPVARYWGDPYFPLVKDEIRKADR